MKMSEPVKMAIALCLIIALATSAVAFYYSFYLPQQVTVTPPPSYGLAVYIDNQPWNDGSKLNWETVQAGSSTSKTLSVQNTGNTNVKVILVTESIPEGITLVWDKNETIVAPGGWANGTLTLTVSSSVAANPYSWDSWVYADSP